jgi:hypothetical protein
VGVARDGSDTAVGVGDIPKGQKKHMLVFVLQASIEILGRLVRILERIEQALPIRFGPNR